MWYMLWREHRRTWLLAVAMMAGLLVAIMVLFSPRFGLAAGEGGLPLGLIAGVLAGIGTCVYGLVCGTLMPARARAARSATAQGLAPGTWDPLWRRKALIGAALVLAHAVVSGGLVLLAGMLANNVPPVGWFAILPLFALDSYAWGLAGAALTRSTEAATSCATALLCGSWLLTPFLPSCSALAVSLLQLLCLSLAATVAYLASRRRPQARSLGEDSAPGTASGWRILFGLVVRQGWIEVGAVVLLALLLPLQAAQLWWLSVFAIGIVAGVMAFAGERKDGKYRFLSDYWLPLWGAWLIRTACCVVGAVLASAAAAQMAAARATATGRTLWTNSAGFKEILDTLHIEPSLSPIAPWEIVTLILATSFSAGQLAGLLLPGRWAAILLAVPLGAALLALWLPSLLMRGQDLWPLLIPPGFLLIAVGLAVWGRSGNRPLSRRRLLPVAGCGVAAVLWALGVLHFRAAAFPDIRLFDGQGFDASLALAERSDAGKQIWKALSNMRWHMLEVLPKVAAEAKLGVEVWRRDMVFAHRISKQRTLVLNEGWPAKGVEELGAYLDALFTAEWPRQLRRAAALPLARLWHAESDGAVLHSLTTDLLPVLEPRAVQLQAQGRDGEALELLLDLLALTRHVCHNTPLLGMVRGRELEELTIYALDAWLQRLGPNAGVLRRLVEELERHEMLRPPPDDALRRSYEDFCGKVDASPRNVGRLWYRLTSEGPREIPWEKERERRLRDGFFASRLVARFEQQPWTVLILHRRQAGFPPPLPKTRLERAVRETLWWQELVRWHAREGATATDWGTLAEREARNLALLRGTRLQATLALYRLEEGQPPRALGDLVPRYFKELPADPFTGQPFKYRISAGERFAMHPQNPGVIPPFQLASPGQGIVWSVGPDGQDQGGVRQGRHCWEGFERWAALGLDLVFVVPACRKR